MDQDRQFYLDATSRRAQLAVLIALAVVAFASFAVAFPGLVFVGSELAHLPYTISYLLPVVLDAGMLTAGLAAAVRRSRREGAALELGLLAGLVTVSIAAQMTHVIVVSEGWSVPTVIGGVVAATAPTTLLLSTESALRAVLVSRKPRRTRSTSVVAPAPESSKTASARAGSRTQQPRSEKPIATTPGTVAGALSVEEAARRVLSSGDDHLSQRTAAVAAGVSRGKIEGELRRQREVAA